MTELEEIEQQLWSTNVGADSYPDTQFQRDLMEQYRICVEMADRISARRGTTNTFFVSLNTAIVGAMGYFSVPDSATSGAIYATLIWFCIAWILLLRSYRGLNTAKFKVIGLMEKRLPASPFFAAEWKALGEGKDPRKHIPLSPLETYVPIGFVVCYLFLAWNTSQ